MMAPDALLAGLLYASPAASCIVISASSIIAHCSGSRDADTTDEWIDAKRRSKYSKAIKRFHICFCIILLLDIAVALRVVWKSFDGGSSGKVDQAYLASAIALFLFFIAMLLPDPDLPYNPGSPNYHAWVTNLIFEVTLIAILSRKIGFQDEKADKISVQLVLHSLKTVILLVMSILYKISCSKPSYTSEAEDAERRQLLGSGSSEALGNGTIENGIRRNKPTPTATDAQSTTWLDYLIAFKTLFRYVWPSDSIKQQIIAVLCFCLLIAQRIVNLLVPYQLAIVVNALGRGKVPLKEIGVYTMYRALQGQQGVIGSIRALLWIQIGQSTYRRLTRAAFEHVLSLSMDFHLGKRIGEVMSALTKGSAINTFLDSLVFQLFPMVADLWIAAIYFFIEFDAFYSLITISVMWTYLFVTIYMAKYRGRARREMAMADRTMDAAKTDAIMSYETVHHNCAVPSELNKFQRLLTRFLKAERSVLLSLNLLNAAQNLIFTFGVLLICLLSAYEISIDVQQVATFVSLLAYFAQLQAPLNFFGSFYTQVQNNLVDAERLLDLFKSKPQVVDGPNAIPLQKCEGKLSFVNVNFAYDPRKPALRNVSFTVEPGTSIAIVGESGSGKSTIIQLLFRFYDVNSGSIRVDDRDVGEMTIDSLRQHIGVVPQDTILFNDTIMYNLMYAKAGATEKEVHDACRAASIHDKIMNFPDGYNTSVGERGLRLSGGEKQRIAIARAILKDPQIMLLDEATASLDSHTEKLIQGSLESVTKGRTTVTIAHRLSTITMSDQILVLHKGQIVERGKHSELLAMNGRYSAMWDKQTRAEKNRKMSEATET